IVTQRRIPITSVQKEISAAHKNDGGEMLPPPVAVVPLLPMAAQRIGEAKMIVFALRIGLHLALWRLMRRQIAASWLRGSDAGLRVRCCRVAPGRFACRSDACDCLCIVGFDYALDRRGRRGVR